MRNYSTGTDGSLSRQASRVEFIPTTARPQPTMPQDISREEYMNEDEVMSSPIPRSQIGTVMSSYEKSIGRFKVIYHICSEILPSKSTLAVQIKIAMFSEIESIYVLYPSYLCYLHCI